MTKEDNKESNIDNFITALEAFIESIVQDKYSPHVEDSVARMNRRNELINVLIEILP